MEKLAAFYPVNSLVGTLMPSIPQYQRYYNLLLHMCVAGLVVFPVTLSPSSTILGSSMVDVWNHVWGPWWWWYNWSEGTLPWTTNLLHYPDGGTLWFIDPVLAMIGSVFAWISPSFAYNMVLFLYVVFASWSARRYAISLGASESTSWIASISFACSAWMLSEISNGITEAVNIGPVALSLACVEDACRASVPSARAKQNSVWKLWATAGLVIGLTSLASPYLGLGTGIAVAVRCLFSIRHTWKYIWFAGLLSIVVASPTILLFNAQLHATDAIIKRPEGMNISLALHNAVDPRTFIAPFGFQSVDLSTEGFVHSMYLGWVALFFAFKSRKENRAWLIAGLLCMLCSLGPYLYWGDGWFLVGGSRLRLPWYALQSVATGLAVTHPLRLAVPCLAIVAGMASVGASTPYWIDRAKWLGLLVALDSLIISGAPFPIPVADASIPKVYDLVQKDPRDVGVLDLPSDAGSTMRTSQYLYWQSYHHKGIPYAPDARASTSSLLSNPAFRRLAAICNRRADENQRLGLHNRSPGNPHAQSLRVDNFGWIVLHRNIDPTVYQQLLEVLQADLGAGMTMDDATIWRLD